MRYIGSKARSVDAILELIGAPRPDSGFFVDAFSGTGVVAGTAADHGWRVRVNDHLRAATVMTRARLVAASDVPCEALGGYEAAIAALNSASPMEGFFFREYSPAVAAKRRYFTQDNAQTIDAIRELINRWEADGLLSDNERDLLVADLIGAANRVANIAGTYGCYLSRWTESAKRPLSLEMRALRSTPVEHEVYSRDVVDVPIAENDVAYFDPPYTKRQYAAYYHILETLAQGDEPEVEGKTGLRPWRDKASDYCYKRRALGALTDLISNTAAGRIFLSYSSEGHVELDDLEQNLVDAGEVTIHPLASVGRYRPNREASSAGEEVTEYVVELQRVGQRQPEVLVG